MPISSKDCVNHEILREIITQDYVRIQNDIEEFLKCLQKAVNVMPNLKNKSKNNKEFEKVFVNKRFVDITSK